MTGYGFVGPMTASGTVFSDKEQAVEVLGTGSLLLMHAGSWFLAFFVLR